MSASMKNSIIGAVMIGLISFFWASCVHEPVLPESPGIPTESGACHPDTVYFQKEILPLLVSSCGVSGCHDPVSARDGVVLTNYASVISTGKVRAGNPNDSDLYESIIETNSSKRMPPPPRQALSAAQIGKIEKWILQGAKNNNCADASCDTVTVSFANHILPNIQTNCLGCHSANQPGGGIALTNHAQIAQSASAGRLMGSIRHVAGFSPMPKNGTKLSNCQITQFKKWIENGTPNN